MGLGLDGDGLAVEAVARVTHQPHARMGAAGDGGGGGGPERRPPPLALLQAFDAREVLMQPALPDELERRGQLHAVQLVLHGGWRGGGGRRDEPCEE